MSRAFFRLCLLLSTAWAISPTSLLAQTPTPHTALPSATIPDGLGTNIHFTHPKAGEMKMLTEAGFRWIRMDFGWAATERQKGQYDFSAFDDLVKTLEENHLRAIFIIDYGNSLYEKLSSVRTEEGRGAYARWAAAATTHFQGKGILWEIWNEPNGGFWKPTANADEYAAMAVAACKAIRAATPGEAIIGPATSQIDFKFLETCFQAGLLQYWDAVSVHPYRQEGPELALPEYVRLRRLIKKYAPAGRAIPIISGEWGYSSAWKNFDPDRQGRMLAREFLINLSEHIPLSIWYDWHEDGTNPKEEEHHFGSVGYGYHAGRDPVYDAKPAYLAAQTLTRTLSGAHFVKRLLMRDPEDYVLLFTKEEKPILAAWTTDAQPHETSLGVAQLKWHRIDLTSKDTDVVAQEHSLKLNLSESPQYFLASEHDTILDEQAPYRAIRVIAMPIPGDSLKVRLVYESDDKMNGPLVFSASSDGAAQQKQESAPVFHMTHLTSMDGSTGEKVLQFLPLKSLPGQDITVAFTLGFPPWSEPAPAVPPTAELHLNLNFPPVHYRIAPDELLKDSVLLPDGDAKIPSTQSFSQSPPLEPLSGAPYEVLKITYDLSPGWKFLRLVPGKGVSHAVEGQPKGFGMWIYGDGQGLTPRLRLRDAAGRTFQPTGEAIEWQGWRYVTFDFRASTPHWGGPKEQGIALPLTWDTLLLLDNASRKAVSGAVYCTSPVFLY